MSGEPLTQHSKPPAELADTNTAGLAGTAVCLQAAGLETVVQALAPEFPPPVSAWLLFPGVFEKLL